jgi:hypothetical protein
VTAPGYASIDASLSGPVRASAWRDSDGPRAVVTIGPGITVMLADPALARSLSAAFADVAGKLEEMAAQAGPARRRPS